MSQEHPELIFVAGPQAGQRVLLTRAEAILGRGSGADILLSEESISRQQLKYVLLVDGPAVENLSDRGTLINRKRYKRGKQVLLETGDILSMGAVTKIVFVAAGDDPEAALQAYGSRHASTLSPVTPPELPVQTPELSPEMAKPASSAGFRKPVTVQTAGQTTEEIIQGEKQARRRKIFIGLGIYLSAIVVVVIVLSMTRSSRRGDPGMAREWSREEIAKSLEARPVGRRADIQSPLEQALALHSRLATLTPRGLYECVGFFKEAHSATGGRGFDNPQHERAFQEAMDLLCRKVADRYHQGCLMERNGDWVRAMEEFRDLLEVVGPEPELGPNVRQHYNRVKAKTEEKAVQKKRPWG